LRAVERFEQVLPVAARLLQPSGRLGFLIGASQVSAAKFALSSLNWDEPIPIPLSQSRVILVGRN
jgi:hypothetical protein